MIHAVPVGFQSLPQGRVRDAADDGAHVAGKVERIEAVCIGVDQDQFGHAARIQPVRARGTDARCGAGDEGDAVCEGFGGEGFGVCHGRVG